jgi:hypothetical protein
VVLTAVAAPGFASGTPVAASGSVHVNVSATTPWEPTSVVVTAGEKLTITATGKWNTGIGNSAPEGVGTSCASGPFLAPHLSCASLIAKIGAGTPFEVGSGVTKTVKTPGTLYLSANDWASSFDDNSGSLAVAISVQK